MDRTLMSNATSSDDAPTPGYMLTEISKATLASYPANVQVQDFLVSRITHKNHNVKYKCLVIIKHICRTGRPEFKREMAKKVDPIKECLQFRGPPDPLRGDEIYRRVRDAAKEALDAIFDSQMPVTTSAVAAANRIQGMGNDYVPAEGSKKEQTGFISSMVSSITTVVMGDGTDAVYAGHAGAQNSFIGGAAQQLPPPAQSSYTSPGYSGPSGGGMIRASSSGMSGIGNPNFKDAREEKSWYQKAGELASNISTNLSISSGPASQPSLNLSSPHPDYSYATNRGPNAVANNEGYSAHRVQNALGSNASTGSFQNWQNNAGGFQSAQHAGVVPDLPATANNLGIVGRVGGAAADGEYERSLIEPLVEPGGLKPVPPEHKLQDFLLAAQTLSPELVGNCLADVLNSDAWQSRVKALIVVAALVLNKECSAHADWWRANVELVRALLSDTKAGVRTQATKTCKIIGGEDDVSAPVSTSTSPKPSTKERSLLGDFHDEPVAPAPASAPAASHSLLDMLDDSPAPVSTPLAPPSLSQPPAPSSGGDLFSGLSIGGTPYLAVAPAAAPAPAPVPAPVAAPVPAPSVSDAFDFLSDAPIVAAPPAAPAAAGGLFDNLQMASSVPPSSSAKANYRDDFAGLSMGPSSANSVSSSFSFMNAGPAPVPTSSPLGRPAPSSSVISTAFVEPSSSSQKSKNDQAFAQLVNFGSSSPNPQAQGGARLPPQQMGYQPQLQQQPYPPQQQPQLQQPYQAQPYQTQGLQPGFPAQPPAYSGGFVNSNLAPAMLNPTAPRKSIPTTDGLGGPSGFSFMGAAPGTNPGSSKAAQADSFNFVTDAMRDMRK